MQYQACKTFTYQGRAYKPGDVWEPSGHRNDPAIIRARLVTEVKPPKEAGAVALIPRQRGRKVE